MTALTTTQPRGFTAKRIEERGLNSKGIFSDLDTLQQMLSIPPVNTGRLLFPTGPAGIVADDIEGLYAYSNDSGRLHLVSGVELQDFLYRGQVEEKLPCVPTLGRIDTLEGRLLSLCRGVAFEEALEVHPFVRKAAESGLHVDHEGMAQHYGLPTDMLDLTGSFAVASFFATCRRDPDSGRYLPVADNAPPGVIYRVTACILEDRQRESFHLVGWQPLPRPEQQRACAIRMKPGQDFVHDLFTTEPAYFKQNAAISRRIWKQFDEGRALFPHDPAAELSKQARALREFTSQQMARAWSRVEAWECKPYAPVRRATVEASSGITLRSSTTLTWDGLDVESSEAQLTRRIEEVLSRVRCRRAMYLSPE